MASFCLGSLFSPEIMRYILRQIWLLMRTGNIPHRMTKTMAVSSSRMAGSGVPAWRERRAVE